ncbi:hypothetical protein [Acinetobacter baumannii]|uniref:hypothetical protein n=1 Tax=Acinetobacter baumannii TaxID=470 RepID=UPI001FB9C4CC|nr:hypothetical protein [Acinetobacter baumannii]
MSAAATLFASVIALILFNDWRDEQEHQVFTELIKTIKQDYRKLNVKYIEDLYSLHEMLHKLKFNRPTQALTFEVIEKITLSYTTFSRVFKEIKSDFNNFDEMYKTILIMKMSYIILIRMYVMKFKKSQIQITMKKQLIN